MPMGLNIRVKKYKEHSATIDLNKLWSERYDYSKLVENPEYI